MGEGVKIFFGTVAVFSLGPSSQVKGETTKMCHLNQLGVKKS